VYRNFSLFGCCVCSCCCREGIKNEKLDEVEARYVHPNLRAAMMKETSLVRTLVPDKEAATAGSQHVEPASFVSRLIA
jgi:hypothetical protein